MYKNLKKMSILSIVFAIGVWCYMEYFQTPSNDENKTVMMFNTEESLTEEKLNDYADLIVIGKITKFIEQKRINKSIKNQDDTNLSILLDYDVYKLEIDSIIKGDNSKTNIDVVFVYGKPNEINLDTEYLFYLEENALKKDKYFSLVSYTQGYFEENYDDDAKSNVWENKNGIKIVKYK